MKISLNDMIAQVSVALDAVEADLVGATRFHSKRVAILSMTIGRELGYGDDRIFGLAAAALLHDNALTEYILSEQKYSGQEINIKSHCTLGESNCRSLPFYTDIQGFILYHHERADGKYAFGKKEGEYPQEAGIIAIADQMDVMFRLNSADAKKIARMKEHLVQETGLKYDTESARAAIKALDAELIKKCSDERVGMALQEEMPEYDEELSSRELIGLAEIFARIIDYKSEFTQEHSTQIANKAWYMSGVYGYGKEERAKLYLAAALHDIGKLFIPTAILEKPGKLDDDEFEVIKSHAYRTWEVLKSIRGLERIADWASNHHEKLNGKGYPFGKAADELDFNSRLLACLDIYQAVREKRPYHPVRSHEDTMDILYHMAENGFVDLSICDDLNKNLINLPDGYAEKP